MAKTILGRWFEVSVKYTDMDNGKQVVRREAAVFDAVSFGDAEKKAGQYFDQVKVGNGDLEVTKINPAKYAEVIGQDGYTESRWFKAKVAFIILDEKTGKEQRHAETFLVEGDTIQSAMRTLEAVLSGSAYADYSDISIAETKITEVVHA